MAVLENLHWIDGDQFNPPENPLKEKWLKEYPPTPHPLESQVCDGYSCMWCGRCPEGDYWKCPEEDKEIYDKFHKEYLDYINEHGGFGNLIFDINQKELEKHFENL